MLNGILDSSARVDKKDMFSFQSFPNSIAGDEMLQSFFVGNFYDPSSEVTGPDENLFCDAANRSSPFIDLERNIALFLGE